MAKNISLEIEKIWLTGKYSQLTENHICYIVKCLYSLKLAEIWFIGMGWPEGFNYCRDDEYLKEWAKTKTGKINREIWFVIPYAIGNL